MVHCFSLESYLPSDSSAWGRGRMGTIAAETAHDPKWKAHYIGNPECLIHNIELKPSRT